MSNDTRDDDRLGTAPTPRPSPRYNVISVGMPFLGVAALFWFFSVIGASGHWYLTWQGPAALAILTCPVLAGIVFASMAWVRSERLWGLTILGFFLNLPLPAALLLAGLASLDTWVRFG